MNASKEVKDRDGINARIYDWDLSIEISVNTMENVSDAKCVRPQIKLKCVYCDASLFSTFLNWQFDISTQARTHTYIARANMPKTWKWKKDITPFRRLRNEIFDVRSLWSAKGEKKTHTYGILQLKHTQPYNEIECVFLYRNRRLELQLLRWEIHTKRYENSRKTKL